MGGACSERTLLAEDVTQVAARREPSGFLAPGMHCITMQCMESQLTVRLPEDLSAALAQAAEQSGRRSSEIVRAALREYLQLTPGSGRRPAERVRGLIGALDSGLPDLAERHRAYLLESLKRGR